MEKETFTIKIVVRQEFTNFLDIEANSEEEAIAQARELTDGIVINNQWSKGYLQDDCDVSTYWHAEDPVEVISLEVSD